MAIPFPYYHRERFYAQTEGRVYTDHSRYLRNRIRSFFLRGQQLWDDDMNSNMEVWGLWRPTRVTNYRKYQNIIAKPPLYSPFITTMILDPVHAATTEETENLIYYFAKGMSGALYLPPLPAQMAYVVADRNVCFFTGSAWKPMLKVDDKNTSVEIAIFASIGAVKRNKVLARYEVQQKFEMLRIGKESRARGIGRKGGFQIRKNGVAVGLIWQSIYSSGVTMMADTVFDPGDVLDIYVLDYAEYSEPVTITLMGKVHYD